MKGQKVLIILGILLPFIFIILIFIPPSIDYPDRCIFNEKEIVCDIDSVFIKKSDVNTITMSLENNVGETITITSTKITLINYDDIDIEACTSKINGDTINDFILAYPESAIITSDCTGGINLIEKEGIKLLVDFNYYPTSSGPNFEKTVLGEIFTFVEYPLAMKIADNKPWPRLKSMFGFY